MKPLGHRVPLFTSNDPCEGCPECIPVDFGSGRDKTVRLDCLCDYAQGIVCASHSVFPQTTMSFERLYQHFFGATPGAKDSADPA